MKADVAAGILAMREALLGGSVTPLWIFVLLVEERFKGQAA